MADTFDLVILGSGPGGYVAAIRASQLGLKVAIVERERLGGICLNWGCIPTKALLRTSEIYHYMQNAESYGLKADNVGFDLAKVVDRSRKVAGQLNAGVKGLMKKNKVTVVEGVGTVTAKGKLSVKQGDKTVELEAKNIIVATGARARDLPFAKADGERIWTYRHAMVPTPSWMATLFFFISPLTPAFSWPATLRLRSTTLARSNDGFSFDRPYCAACIM